MPTATPLDYKSVDAGRDVRVPGANWSLALLLAINLFNYVDRYVLSAVLPKIEEEFPVGKAKLGLLGTAFLLSYMLISPIFGWLADRMSRWVLVALGVILWSLASGASGWAQTFTALLITRCFVGVGEAAYGPVAPTILSDLYPVRDRGKVLSWFYLAIPVGGALGYVVGGALEAKFSWRGAFYALVPPGILLGIWSLFMKDRRGAADPDATSDRKVNFADYKLLLRNRSYVLDTLGMAAMTFAIGGIAYWMPHYVVEERHYSTLAKVNLVIGGTTVLSGLLATLLGGWAGDWFHKKHPGSYFIVSGAAMLLGFPLLLGMLFVPFPLAYVLLFLSCFCLFFNTGPSNAILANVTHPAIRATGFAINIFVIHLLGDAASPTLVGWMSERWGMNFAFTVVSFLILVGGLFWLWGAKYLEADTESAPWQLTPRPTPA